MREGVWLVLYWTCPATVYYYFSPTALSLSLFPLTSCSELRALSALFSLLFLSALSPCSCSFLSALSPLLIGHQLFVPYPRLALLPYYCTAYSGRIQLGRCTPLPSAETRLSRRPSFGDDFARLVGGLQGISSSLPGDAHGGSP